MVKRKKTRSTAKDYFTLETQQAIVKFNTTEDIVERNKIFSEEIYYPLYKLTENIIHTFNFYYMDTEDVESLKNRVVKVLYDEKLKKYKPELGYKAFSFFGTIVKRWLINFNKINYSKLKKVGSFEEVEELETELVEPRVNKQVSLKDFVKEWAGETVEQVDRLFIKEEERKASLAVLTIFEKVEDLKVFKKKAIYMYVREITDCETPVVTKVIKELKELFYEKYKKYIELDLIDVR